MLALKIIGMLILAMIMLPPTVIYCTALEANINSSYIKDKIKGMVGNLVIFGIWLGWLYIFAQVAFN